MNVCDLEIMFENHHKYWNHLNLSDRRIVFVKDLMCFGLTFKLRSTVINARQLFTHYSKITHISFNILTPGILHLKDMQKENFSTCS